LDIDLPTAPCAISWPPVRRSTWRRC
jgi:hypothetical protein